MQQPCRIESALSHYHYALANGMKDPKSLAWACEALRTVHRYMYLYIYNIYATYFYLFKSINRPLMRFLMWMPSGNVIQIEIHVNVIFIYEDPR